MPFYQAFCPVFGQFGALTPRQRRGRQPLRFSIPRSRSRSPGPLGFASSTFASASGAGVVADAIGASGCQPGGGIEPVRPSEGAAGSGSGAGVSSTGSGSGSGSIGTGSPPPAPPARARLGG